MITEQQNKEILESESFTKFCATEDCRDCVFESYIMENECADAYYKIKLEAEKAKVEKLKKCVEFYADLSCNDEAYDSNNCYFFIDESDISSELWTGKNANEDTISHRGRYYGKLARQTLKKIEG